jgi:tetratricopeptide (TPR) repeat protein
MMLRTQYLPIFFLMIGMSACAAPKSVSQTTPSPAVKKVKAEPGDFQRTYLRSLAYLERGEVKKARVLLEELAASNDSHSAIFNALGAAYRREGMINEAVEAYNNAIKLQENYVEAHYNLGIAYRENGQFEKAEVEYKKAIALDPNFASAHYNLGILYDLYADRPADALKHYKIYKVLAGNTDKLDVWIKDLEGRVQEDALSTGMTQTGGEPQ